MMVIYLVSNGRAVATLRHEEAVVSLFLESFDKCLPYSLSVFGEEKKQGLGKSGSEGSAYPLNIRAEVRTCIMALMKINVSRCMIKLDF